MFIKRSLLILAAGLLFFIALSAPGAADALDVNFGFYANGGKELLVSGKITGLKDSATNQKYTPIEVTITSGPDRSVGTYYYGGGDGFTTKDGKIIADGGKPWNWRGQMLARELGPFAINYLNLADPNSDTSELLMSLTGPSTAAYSMQATK